MYVSVCLSVCWCVSVLCVCVCVCMYSWMYTCTYIRVLMHNISPRTCAIVLREDDNSEKTNSYIDAAIGKREPVEKVNSIHLVHTYLYTHHHHYRCSDWCVYIQWPIMASSLNCWNSINMISFRYVYTIHGIYNWNLCNKNRMDMY